MDNQIKQKIDFVVPWVDGADPEWIATRDEYIKRTGFSGDYSPRHYRDFGLMRYWFRGVEKYAPWVNKVYFITSGQLPKWLNLRADKLVWIKHEDYIPNEFLPTFSANPIELNLNRIVNLSEHFVYFNDDMFLINKVEPEHFFREGLPVMSPQISFTVPKNEISGFAHMMLNNVMLINTNFRARKVILKNAGNWVAPWNTGLESAARNMIPLFMGYFTGFSNPHMPSPLLKSTMDTVWEKEREYLAKTSSNKFRSFEDVTQYIFSDWQLASGKYSPEHRKELGHYFQIDGTKQVTEKVVNSIRKQKYSTICLNDSISDISENALGELKNQLSDAFENILPEKSGFEK